MNDNHDDDSKDLGKFGGILALGMIVLLILSVLLLVFGIFFFGVAGFFSLLGVTYDSVKVLVYFTGLLFVIDFLLEPISKIIAGLFSRSFHSYIRFIIRSIFMVAFSSLSFYITDECISGITIPVRTEVLLGLIFFLIELVFEDRPKRVKD